MTAEDPPVVPELEDVPPVEEPDVEEPAVDEDVPPPVTAEPVAHSRHLVPAWFGP